MDSLPPDLQAEPEAAPPPPTRHDRALALIYEAAEKWKAQHYPGLELSEQVRMMAARVPTWIAPSSVVAGVGDILSGVRAHGERPSVEQIAQLGNEIASILRDHGLLAATPRRGGLLETH